VDNRAVRSVFVASLVALGAPSCSGAFSEGPADARPSPWSTGALTCLSADGCPNVHCGCVDDSEIDARGCVAGTCIDDGEEFCADYCDGRGGRESSTVTHLYACLGADDRDACLGCRDEAGRTCNEGECSDALDALLGCLADRSPQMPEGAEFYGWDGAAEGFCAAERDAHRTCVIGCDAFAGCVQSEWHPPLVR
jgi:hypothetical protein